MPAAIAVPAIATAIAGGVTAAAGIVGSHKAATANRRAGEIQARSNTEAIAFAREQEAARQREWQAEQARLAQQEARARADWEAQEARKAPARQLSRGALIQMSRMIGMDPPPMPEAPTYVPREPVSALAPTPAPQAETWRATDPRLASSRVRQMVPLRSLVG